MNKLNVLLVLVLFSGMNSVNAFALPQCNEDQMNCAEEVCGEGNVEECWDNNENVAGQILVGCVGDNDFRIIRAEKTESSKVTAEPTNPVDFQGKDFLIQDLSFK